MHKKYTQANVFAFLKSELISHLEKYHPRLIRDASFISMRSDVAAQYFCKQTELGIDEKIAYGEAKCILLQELLFSKYDIIKDIYTKGYQKEPFTEKDEEMIQSLLDECEDIFHRYDLSDKSINSPQHIKLYSELKEKVQSILD
ncbi:MAG: DUF1896 family protein [Dysgonomonas sp.]